MAKVDMKAWYEANKLKLEEAKKQFVDAMTADEAFLELSQHGDQGNQIVFGHGLDFKYAAEINLNPVDELINALGDVDFVMPSKPSELNNARIDRYKTHIFDDWRLDLLENKFNSLYSGFTAPTAYELQSGSLNEQIQAAFYDYQYDRDKEQIIHEIDEEASAWAADGYRAVPGAMSYNISQRVNQFDRQRQERTSSVFAQLAQTAQSNIQKSIENGVKIEDLHMDFAIQYSEMSKLFIQSAIDAYLAEINKRLSEQKAQISKIGYLVKSIGLDTEADIEKNKLELAERNARLDAYISATNSFIEQQAGTVVEQLRLAANIAEGYGGLFSSYGSLFTGISYEE